MSTTIIRRMAPIWLAAFVAVLMNFEYFINTTQGSYLASTLRTWAVIAAAFAYILAAIIITMRHGHVVRKKVHGQWYFSVLLLISLWGMIVYGLALGPGNVLFVWIFQNIVVAVYSTMLGTCAFFVTSAAYRAFRVRTGEAAVMLLVTALVMMSQATVGEVIWSGFAPIGHWLVDVPMNAGGRGLAITIALGFMALCLRIISGLETRWLGE